MLVSVYQLQDDLSELRRVGLRNRQYTLMLSRVMVRAESEHTRSQLLVLLQAAHANTPCLRLFMDYHGLSLLWSWMADLGIDLEHAPLKLEVRLPYVACDHSMLQLLDPIGQVSVCYKN